MAENEEIDLSAGMVPHASLGAVPDFEKPIAQGLQVVPGNEPDAIAHTEQGGNKVYVDDASKMSQPILDHEVMHKIQEAAGNFQPGQDNYDYGGIDGLKKIGGNVAKLNVEQQANIPQDYTAQMAAWQGKPITPLILKQADMMNSAYARPMTQLANMANLSKTTIDTTPQAPGPPPAELTGAIKPLPQIGGRTLVAPQQMQKGTPVQLADGRQGSVAYHQPALDIARVRLEGGGQITTKGKALTVLPHIQVAAHIRRIPGK